MTLADVDVKLKPFEPGTTGWTEADLDDPAIERQWFAGRYEIVEGVLTITPPAYFSGGESSFRLAYLIESYLRAAGVAGGGFSPEADIVMDVDRVVRADFAYLTAAEKLAQREAVRAAGRVDPRRARLLVPPTLVIESVSPGHEAHDRQTKRRWYAEFGVPNYWLLDAFERTLECLVLDGRSYRADAAGRGNEVLRPVAFPDLCIPLQPLWED